MIDKAIGYLYHEMFLITDLHREISCSDLMSYELNVNRAFTAATTLSEESNILSIMTSLREMTTLSQHNEQCPTT